ncbi:MAG: DUF6434 domain-containing protein [Oscillospiraceae bacterium]|jgi:hypothetical protein|nr:DUF6434 domain-containing protein [Oscillospiraceae bacterium]
MSKNSSAIPDGTVIDQSVSLGQFREFFAKTVDREFASGKDFQNWLNTQTGKTLKEAVAAYHKPEPKSMAELLSEERFNIISASDKAFIKGFDSGINKLGYDFGGSIGSGYCWGKFMIIYAKTGVKSKKVIARIYIREDGVVLRLFFDNIDKHSVYIQNAPDYIGNVFTGNHGDCSCNPKKENCRMRKTYAVGGKQMEKCSGVVFEFWKPGSEKLPGYLDLLSEFYPVKNMRAV